MDQLTLPHDSAGHAIQLGPWSIYTYKQRYRRNWRWLIAAAIAIPLLAAAAGYGLAWQNINALVATRLATGDYYLPISSRQLTVTIQPCTLGPDARAALNAQDSDRERTADELLSEAGLSRLVANLDEIYPFSYAIAAPREIPDEFFSAERQQYRVDELLNWLCKEVDPASFRTVAVLPADIYQPGFNFLFGLAKIGGPACIAGCARMGSPTAGDAALADERWHSIVRHELGHTLGLQHNADWQSVMAYGDSLNQLDQQGVNLTAADWKRLREMHPIQWDE